MNTERTKTEIRLELPREMYGAELKVAGENYDLGEPESLPPDPDSM